MNVKIAEYSTCELSEWYVKWVEGPHTHEPEEAEKGCYKSDLCASDRISAGSRFTSESDKFNLEI